MQQLTPQMIDLLSVAPPKTAPLRGNSQTAWQDLLRSLTPTTRELLKQWQKPTKKKRPLKQWHLVVVPDNGQATLKQYHSISLLLSALSKLVGKSVQTFVFFGTTARITGQRCPRLELASGRVFDLVLPEEADHAVLENYLGRPLFDRRETPMTQAKAPRRRRRPGMQFSDNDEDSPLEDTDET